MAPRGLPRYAAAEYIGCGPTKFEEMVTAGEMPKPRRIGSKRVWDRLELDESFDALPQDGVNDWDGESEN